MLRSLCLITFSHWSNGSASSGSVVTSKFEMPGIVCRRCGISPPTLRKWLRRYRAQGVRGLLSQSRRPRRSARRKVGLQEIALILDLRRSRRLGIKRLRNELIRLHQVRFSLATIHKVLRRHNASRLAERRWRRRVP
jgi:transposase